MSLVSMPVLRFQVSLILQYMRTRHIECVDMHILRFSEIISHKQMEPMYVYVHTHTFKKEPWCLPKSKFVGPGPKWLPIGSLLALYWLPIGSLLAIQVFQLSAGPWVEL